MNVLLDYIYPRNIKCMICKGPIPKTNIYSLCKDCFKEIHFIQKGCKKCGKPLTLFYKERYCPNCIEKKYYFERSFSCVEYNEKIHKIIYGFKYGGKTYLAYHIAKIMEDKINYEGIDFDYIIPVPLHKNRQKKRGFNQTVLISRNLGKFIGKEVVDILKREKDTPFLSKLSKKEREFMLKDVFTISKDEHKIKGKNILLIDDIFTTGSTTNEIAKILIEAGGDKVYILSFTTGKNIY